MAHTCRITGKGLYPYISIDINSANRPWTTSQSEARAPKFIDEFGSMCSERPAPLALNPKALIPSPKPWNESHMLEP